MSVRAVLTPVESHGALTVSSGAVCNDQGRRVILRGMSLFWSQWMGQFYNRSALAWLRDDWRVDVVRASMGVHEGGYLECPSRERRKIYDLVESAIDLGIYVVVDWHAHEMEMSHARSFFTDLSKRYGRYPHLIFEPWNEPAPVFNWNEHIKPYHQVIIETIREFSQNLIVVGTERFCQWVDVAAVAPITAQNVAYALHFYAASHREKLRTRAERALTSGIALMVTEWGAGEATGDGRLDWPESLRWLAFLERRSISHINWSLSDKPEACAALAVGAKPSGKWGRSDLTASGTLVREYLRDKAVWS